ncbi:MAG: ribosome biogenesis/translation initiation ATPase RLI [Candidatus Nanohaloarchaea archaeon]
MDQDKPKDVIAVVDREKCRPDKCNHECINFDPINRSGGEGFHIGDHGKAEIDDDVVTEAHKICAKKCPFNAIKIVNLDQEVGEKIHQFSENSFRLYSLPQPKEGMVVGMLGRNGIGKSTALKILAGNIKPNLGDYEDEPSWDRIMEEYRGTGLQDHFGELSEGEVDAAFKPQQVDKIPGLHDGTVKELLEEVDERDALESVAETADIGHLLEREIDELSGGELQRVAIASTMLKDASLYVFDEPSSFLDVKQRLKMGRAIRELGQENKVLVVEHDLATLDLVSHSIHVFHGDPGAYGMVSNALSSREGINQYLDGYLKSHNLQIRSESISFDRSKRSDVENKPVVLEFPEMEKDFGEDEFSLEVAEGELHEEEILGIFGENGLGKTTFARMLAGAVEPETGETPDVSVSYKPQYLESQNANVRGVISRHVNPESKKFKARIAEPLELEELYEQDLEELSGGELQKVGIAIALSRDADVYLLDEPSAYLDVESRVKLGKVLKRFARKTEKPLMVIDHDLLLLDYIADRGMVFTGEPGVRGEADSPVGIEAALNTFLEEVDLTFRKDPESGRPRANKPGSQKDREQRERGEYYEQ